MDTAIVLFTRDLRLHSQPGAAPGLSPGSAGGAAVRDRPGPGCTRSANRARFLAEFRADLRASLRVLRGADLVPRRGDPAAEVIRLAAEVHATAVYIADDVSHYATARRHKLERECARHRIDLTLTPGLTVVPPGELRPAGGPHYRVFTPYWRAWRAAAWRKHCPVPPTITPCLPLRRSAVSLRRKPPRPRSGSRRETGLLLAVQ